MIPARVWGRTLLLAGVLSCGGGGDGEPRTPTGPGPGPGPGPGTGGGGSTSSAVDVRDNFFSPDETTVAPGTTVTWTWRGQGTHDVVFPDAQSPRQSTGTYSRTFAAAGTFTYLCQVHGSSMSGTVIVR